jgi:osmotically-inducible protein OsmY
MAKKSDAELTRDILDEMLWDPDVDISDLGVTVDHGNVTLSGTTATYADKWEADDAAYRVLGVKLVKNDIVVNPAALGIRPDSDIAQDVRSVLALDVAVPDTRINTSVSNGIVTLTGDVDWNYQLEDAVEDAAAIRGVRGIDSHIQVHQPAVLAANISDNIRRAFARNAELFDDNIMVTATEGGHVTLSGTVETWSERDMAENVAWRAAGVTDITDNILVEMF